MLPRPHIYTHLFYISLPCGTMSLICLTFCRRRGRTAGVGFSQDGGDRVDSGPCAKYNLSDGDRKAYLTPRDDTRNVYLYQREDRTIAI